MYLDEILCILNSIPFPIPNGVFISKFNFTGIFRFFIINESSKFKISGSTSIEQALNKCLLSSLFYLDFIAVQFALAISRAHCMCIAMEGLVTQIIHSFMTGNEQAIQTSPNRKKSRKTQYQF